MNIPKKTINIGGEIFEVPDLSRLFGRGIWGILIVLIVIWLLTGIYIVSADQQGVVRRFGAYNRTTSPGIHWRIPYPVDRVDKVRVKKIWRIEIGFRTKPRLIDRPDESLMLTGALNIVDCDVIVLYKIIDPKNYLFNVRDVERTIQLGAEAALRQVIGKHEIDEALTTGKIQIQEETKEQLQRILDLYEIGLMISEIQLQSVHAPNAVQDAFKDVASAKEDLSRMIKQAEGYYNDLIPRTRGHAAKVVKNAQAWASERVTKAEGDAENFIRILNEYHSAKEVTRKRMLLETMEEILPRVQMYILKADKTGNLMNVIGLPGLDNPSKGGRR